MLYESRLEERKGESTDGVRRAVVIGGSIGGMMAARALADHYDEVVIVERDHIPPGAEHRPGVPHARHLHFFMKRGLMVVDQLFPGVRADLLAAGSHQVDQGTDFRILYRYGWSPRVKTGLEIITFTRPLLESTIRRHLTPHPKVRFIEGFEVAGLVTSEDRSAVTGIRIVPRRRVEGETEEQILRADLVVDSAGRMSPAPQWLEEIGYAAPEESEVDAFWGYATRIYEAPADWQADWKILLLMNRPPYQPRAGIIQPIEGGRWLVTIAGVMHDYPPTDDEGFLQFARSLSSPELYNAITQAKPVSKIWGYRKTSNRLRQYDKLAKLPKGFVALGDSVCAFNPVYGLGMTLTGLEVEELQRCLRESDGGRTLDPLTFQKAVAKQVTAPWALTTGEDLRWPATQGGEITPKVKLMHWYIDQVIRLIPSSPEVYLAFQEVNHMLKGPESLFRPAVLFRVLKQALTPAKTPKAAKVPATVPAMERQTSTVTMHR
ncbi:MAG TPA: 2-polyprenyl-6-methoxyphenol hydroxylase-like oxidoreductase [Thermoanaerobaculia bacterium]|nr:2-polyprenyl-6-methoxyphenol hydroxylase-like oxidoreductase [Thermoanaerobaculia bacterium]